MYINDLKFKCAKCDGGGSVWVKEKGRLEDCTDCESAGYFDVDDLLYSLLDRVEVLESKLKEN